VFIEFVPLEGSDLKEMLITDLDNYAMPFIRYEIGDIAEPAEQPCPCGRPFPLLKRIEGRTFDLVRAPNGRFVGGTFWTLLTRKFPGIIKFRVVQEKEDEIEFSLVTGHSFHESSLEKMEREIRTVCGDMRVRFRVVKEIPVLPSGKFRFVICNLGGSSTGGKAGAQDNRLHDRGLK
jgi:phenylacetate-CoA ligase